MISEPNEIKTSSLNAFVNSNELVVLRANSGSILGFNTFLQYQLQQEFKTIISVGWIDLLKIDYENRTIIDFIKVWIPRIGLPPTNSIFPGYYLFKKGKLVAYHPGTIEYHTKEDANLIGVSTITSAIAGLLVGIFTKDAVKGLEAFLQGMETPQAFKVFEFFKKRLEGTGGTHSQQRQKTVFKDELQRAYELLEVTPYSSDEEIQRAKKRLQFKYHPDRNHHNVEECTKISAEINNAYDLIMKSRVKNKQQA